MTPPARAGSRSLFGAPLWVSGFRPFFLLGASYGLCAMVAWLGAYAGLWELASVTMAPTLWHGHEMVFGFATAIICG